jgi:acyl-CoA thioesterase I
VRKSETLAARKRSMLITAILLAVIAIMLFSLFYLFGMGNQPKNTIRVACVGDSITEGTKYPHDLADLLGTNYSVSNFGVGGATISLESEKPYKHQPEFAEAKESLPNIVIIILGTNDAPLVSTEHILNFTADYEELIGEFKALTSQPKIWLVKPPPIFSNGTGLSPSYYAQEVIPRINQVANDTGVPLIDVYSLLINHPEYFSDGVHPNGEGSAIVAMEIFKAITAKPEK